MSLGVGCCTPGCTTEIPAVNIPGSAGPAGPAGADGSDGINAFTFTTSNFIVPPIGSNVTVPVAENSWMVVGQPLSLPGPAHFEVVSLSGTTSVTLQFLGYSGDVSPGSTITTGSKVSPSGTQPDFSLLPAQSFYAVGGSQALTASNAQLLSAMVTLPSNGDYLISASVRLDFDEATTMTNKTVFLKLRETTNGPADVSNAVRELATGIVTADNSTFSIATIPNVVYSGSAGDTIQLQGSLSATLTDPYESGDVIAVEATIQALPIA